MIRRWPLRMAWLNLRVWWTSPRTGHILRTARACVLATAAGFVLVPLAWEMAHA